MKLGAQILTGGDTATCPDSGDVLTALTVGESDREPCRRVRGIGTGDAANKYAVKAISIRLEQTKLQTNIGQCLESTNGYKQTCSVRSHDTP